MILGCIADDFTGAGDIASILTTAGMRTSVVTRVDAIAKVESDAAVVALKTRSIPAADAVRQTLAALAELRAAGCRQIVFKYCSTFDSTPNGNIGPVAEALAMALDVTGVVVCPAFPANGRTVYQGNLFVGDVPLSESGMRHHPITQMTDSDIRRWLQRQTRVAIGHVRHEVVRQGRAAIAAALASGERLMIVDAIDDDDLLSIGAAVRGAPLVTGGSALAQALPANFEDVVLSPVWSTRRNDGPAIVLAGSCSIATNAQVARYRARHPTYAVPMDRLMRGDPLVAEIDAFASSQVGAAPLVYSTASPDAVTTDRNGAIAAAIERLLADVALAAIARGVSRLVIAGGETSGAIVSAIGADVMDVGATIAPGVPMLYAGPLSLALKSGNFGQEDFFERAVAQLEGPS